MASIKYHDVELPDARLEQPEYIRNLEHGVPPTVVYVCLDNETHAVQVGLALQQALAGTSTPITVRKHRDWGIAPFHDGRIEEFDEEQAEDSEEQPKAAGPRLRIFPLLNRTCRPMLAQSTALNRVMARLTHAEYLRNLEKQRERAER